MVKIEVYSPQMGTYIACYRIGRPELWDLGADTYRLLIREDLPLSVSDWAGEVPPEARLVEDKEVPVYIWQVIIQKLEAELLELRADLRAEYERFY